MRDPDTNASMRHESPPSTVVDDAPSAHKCGTKSGSGCSGKKQLSTRNTETLVSRLLRRTHAVPDAEYL